MGINTNGRPRGRLGRVDPWLLPATLLGLIPILSLLRPGIASTADGVVHLLRSLQVAELLKSGVLYPQWAPDFYFGYGYPFFLFYAPGVHIATALLALTGLGAPNALVAAQILALLLYGVGGYLAAKALYRPLAQPRVVSMAALASAALYVYAPLRLRELFVQGNLSQLVALGLLPWCLWALLKAAQRPSLRWAAISGLLLAALLYAHHAAAFLAYPPLLVIGLAAVNWRSDRRRAAIVALVTAFALALALSAAFWLPWLLESGYGSLERMETGFNAAASLVPADQLFSPSLIVDAASINSPRPLTLGLAQAILAGIGALAAVLLLRRARDRDAAIAARLLLVAGGLLLVCLLLMLPLAAPLWTRLPLAKVIAFPWRLLGPAGLLAALLGGAPLLLLGKRAALAGLLAALLIAPLNVAPYLFPAPSLWRPTDTGGLTLADIGRYETSGGSRGTASANEYLPRWVEDADPPLDLLEAYEAGQLPERLDAASLPPGSQFVTLKSAPLETIHRLTLPQAATVIIRRFYYPGWRAYVDGREVAIQPSSPYGLIQVDAPAGEHELRVMWGQTGPRIAGFVLFGLGLVATLALLARGSASDARPDRFTKPVRSESREYYWLAATGFILLLTLVKAAWIEPRTSWFRLASSADAPAGMTQALHLKYGNGIELLGYDLPATEVRQGGELRVRLFWRATQPLDDDARSFVHLDAPVTGVTWANVTKDQAGEMPSHNWPASGFYVVDDFRLSIPADAPPVAADLTVGLLTREGETVPLPDGSAQVTLAQVAIGEAWRPLTRLPAAQGAYRVGEAITLRGYRAEASAADEVALTLYWQTSGALSADYTVFAQIFDANGQLAGQLDGPACARSCPSSRWTPEGIIADVRSIPLKAGTPRAGLRVDVGLYDPATGERLPVFDANGREMPDRAIPIEVASPKTR